MTRTTIASSRRPLPSALASAIVGSLLAAAALPAIAAGNPLHALDQYAQQRSLQAAAWAQPSALAPRAVATAPSADATLPKIGRASCRERG